MKSKGQEKRQHIVEVADDLFYHQGYNNTSFSEVAGVSGIPKGNFYYYFKSKDDLLHAVIDMRAGRIQKMLESFTREDPDPRVRLQRLTKMVSDELRNILRYGCPMGTINAELGKTRKDLQGHAKEMFDLFVDWSETQFQVLGKGEQSRMLSLHLMALLQGLAMVSNVYEDREFLEHEVGMVKEWLDQV
jgi:AcrR family transcriptional regulator